MKPILQYLSILFLISLFFTTNTTVIFGQTAFNYQAVVRTADGTPINNQEVLVNIQLRRGSALGNVVYEEDHEIETNDFGIINLQVGRGTNAVGSMNLIDWGAGAIFMEVQIGDPETGIMTPMGVAELLTVPFAMFSQNSGSPGPEGPQGPRGEQGPEGPIGP